METTPQQAQTLIRLDPAAVKTELAMTAPTAIMVAENQLPAEVRQAAEQLVQQVIQYDPANEEHLTLRTNSVASVESLGLETQRDAARLADSDLLQTSVKELAERGDEGGEVGTSLLQLNRQVLELDPSDIDFTKQGGFKRFISGLPFVGDPVTQYFARYQSGRALIAEIVQSMVNGKNRLARDNAILGDEQRQMRATTLRLEQAIMLGLYLDQRLDAEIVKTGDEERRRFLQDELLFPLRQRVQDLQQQLAVSQQGVLTFELIIRNNKELVKGVDRAQLVTVSALQIAVSAAIALGHQDKVVGILDAVNETTGNLIAHTAQRLKTQGVDIHKRAASQSIDPQKLVQAFRDIRSAMDDITTFKSDALPKMRENIQLMHQLTGEAKKAIERMEQGTHAEAQVKLDIPVGSG
jgi:uncharacterized protein YaaN involved in tellurite resistance